MVENPMLLFDIHKDNPLLIRYLKNCNSEKTQVRREVDKALRGAIGSCIQQCIDSLPQVENLSSSLQALDIHLAKAEEILTTFETRLTEVTENIRICHETSTKTKELINQKQTELSVLETYIKQILVTPDMIQCICEGKVDSNYLQQMETIEKKIECCKQPGVQINLSAREALPELEKLYTEGLKRIKSHLMNAFTCFTKSQTNVQILQRNVLNSKSLFSFLAMNDPSSSVQLRTHYVTIMTNVHHSRYSNYCTALWRHFPTEGLATSNDTLGQSSRFNGAMTTFFGHRPTIDPDPKPQFFTSAGRSDIFSRLREDPSLTERVVKTSGESSSSSVEAQTTTTSGVIAGKSTCNLLEQFRSTLRLLMDFSTSEYLFISQFFMSKVEPFVVVNDHGDDEIANHHPSFLSRHQLEILFQDLTKR